VNLLDSLLDAIVRLDGDALVMHVGEKPYVVTTSAAMNELRGPLAWGQVELSSRVLTSDAVLGMLGPILPLDQRQALEEFGAIEHDIRASNTKDRFTVIAARGGDDVWLEVRRHRYEEPPVLAQPSEGTDAAAASDASAPAPERTAAADAVPAAIETAPAAIAPAPFAVEPAPVAIEPAPGAVEEPATVESVHADTEERPIADSVNAHAEPAVAVPVHAHAEEPALTSEAALDVHAAGRDDVYSFADPADDALERA
jgi:hypothetical protein